MHIVRYRLANCVKLIGLRKSWAVYQLSPNVCLVVTLSPHRFWIQSREALRDQVTQSACLDSGSGNETFIFLALILSDVFKSGLILMFRY